MSYTTNVFILIWIISHFTTHTRQTEQTAIQVLEGEVDVELKCIIPVNATLNGDCCNISWYFVKKYSETLLAKNEEVHINYFRVIYNKLENSNSLIFKRIYAFLKGKYICKQEFYMETSDPIIVSKVHVEVFDPPPDPKMTCGIDDTDMLENEVFNLTLRAQIGNLPAKFKCIILYVDGTNHTLDDSKFAYILTPLELNSLVKVNVTRTMSKIRCFASHSLLQSTVSCITPTLNVRCKPKFIRNLNSVMYKPGQKFNITIDVHSNPKPVLEISASSNEIICKTTENYFVNSSSTYLFQWNVSISNELTVDDNGTSIKLHTSNYVGEDILTFDLYASETYFLIDDINSKSNGIKANSISIAILFFYAGIAYTW